LSEKAADVRMPMGPVIARAPDFFGCRMKLTAKVTGLGQRHFVITNRRVRPCGGRADNRLAKQSTAVAKSSIASAPFAASQ